MPDLGIFELEFENNIVKFEIGTHWFCLIAKHREIMEMPKFRTKNVLFRYIWAWILKNYWHIWNQRPRTCHKRTFNSYSEFWYRVWKCLNFGPKMLYFGIFGLEFKKKTIVIYEINVLKVVENESLTHTVNIGIGFALSEGPGPGPGPLYKVCQLPGK